MSILKHVVGFSGGADSQATALWVRQHFPPEDVLLVYSDPGGNDNPITTEFIRHYSATIFPVVVVTPLVRDMAGRGTKPGQARDRRQTYDENEPLTFDILASIKGRFPSRKAQFCTEHLKLIPQRRWLYENLADVDFERYVGIRRQEGSGEAGCMSAADFAPATVLDGTGRRLKDKRGRGNTPLREWDEYFDCYVNYPLAFWSKAEVFDYLKAHGEEPNPLYKMGFARVGCAPCINSSKEDIRLWAARDPAMIDKIRVWEQKVGRTFFAPCIPGYTVNWIDEVVSWAKTSRGGRQFDLPMLEADAAHGTCSSKYGLCE